MLLAIRDRARGWFAFVIIGLIAIPFAFFGVYNYFTGSGGTDAAARVNDSEISSSEVSTRYRQQRQQLEQWLGDQFDIEHFDHDSLRRDALEQLINERLLGQYVNERGFRVTDAELARLIRSQTIFHENGRFSADRYRELLRNNMITPDGYEANVRHGYMQDQLRNAIFGSALVTDADIDRLVGLERQRRSFEFVSLPISRFLDPSAIADDAVAAFYEENPALFERPEQVRLEYLAVSEAQLRSEIDIDEATVRERYRMQQDRFTQSGERDVRHILIQVPEDASQSEVAAARERAEALREQLLEGASFAELAQEYSEDPGSADAGGELGTIERGMMVDAFDQAAFALAEGELSEPIRTPFGIHLIEATRVEPDVVRPFEEVAAQIEREIADERVGTRIYELVERLGNLTYETPDSLEPAAEELGLTIQRTDWFARDGADEGIARSPRIVDAAFSDEVMEEGYNSEPLTVDGMHVVIRLDDRRPATVLPLEEVEDRVREHLAMQRAREQAREQAEALEAQLEADHSLLALAQAEGLEADSVELAERNSTDAPRAVVERVFQMSRPADGEAHSAIMPLGNGDLVLVHLTAVQEGDPEEVSDEERAQYREFLRRAYGQAALEDLIAQLRQEGDVEVFEDRL